LTRGENRTTIAGPAGALEVVLNLPVADPRGIALVAHPHPLQGGTLDNKVAQTLAKTFVALGYASIRLNFRGVGKSEGEFDDGVGETDDALSALEFARAQLAELAATPPVLAGFSFGCYVQARVTARVTPERVVLVGPAVNRFAADMLPADTIVIHGEQDDVVALADVFAWARPQQLPIVVFPACGHFFHGRLPQLQRTIAGMWRR
jgi:alpha/beta superfamily hydrolase